MRREVRQLLERWKFAGRDITWIEHKCWGESEFTIRGPAHTLQALKSIFKESE